MLDPINAINLASSIAQLVDFSAKLLKDASDIRSKGSPVDVGHVKTLALDLIGLREAVRKRPRLQGLGAGNSLIREEEVRASAN